MDILLAFESLIIGKAEYCIFCFRSAKERRLVKPLYLEGLLKHFCDNFKVKDEEKQRVCYICERQAATAFRIAKAARLTETLHTLYRNMETNRKTQDKVYASIHNNEWIKLKPSVDIAELSRCLCEVRACCELRPTEVLMLNTLQKASEDDVYVIPDDEATDGQPVTTGQPLPTGQSISTGQPVTTGKSIATGKSGQPLQTVEIVQSEPEPDQDTIREVSEDNALAEPEIFMDTVEILDEEDPIIVPKEETEMGDPLSRPHTPMIIPDSYSILLDSPIPDSAIILPDSPPLHRKKPANRKKPTNSLADPTVAMSTPTMTNASANSGPTLIPINRLLESAASQEEPRNFMLHPIVETNGVVSVPSLSAQIVNGKLISVDQCNVVIQTPKLAIQEGSNFHFVVDPGKVSDILKTIDRNMLSVVQEQTNFTTGQIITNPQLQRNFTPGQIITNPQFVQGNVQIDASNFLLNDSNILGNMNNLVQSVGQQMLEISNVNSINMNPQPTPPKPVSTCIPNETIVIDLEPEPQVRAGQSETKRRRQDVQPAGSSGTDWEDKIPMDVISFMDATDPNADEALRRAGPVRPLTATNNIAVISDVRSILEPGPAQTDNQQTTPTHANRSADINQMATISMFTNHAGQPLGQSQTRKANVVQQPIRTLANIRQVPNPSKNVIASGRGIKSLLQNALTNKGK